MKKILALALAGALALSTVPVMAETAEPTYTYNGSTSVFPTNWNPHQYKTDTDNSLVMGFIADGFYGFDYNEDKSGYVMANRMAVGEPVDVTADYVGEEWGIPEGATARAWKYTIRDDMKWNDGTPITAQDYVESVKRQLNPAAQNYRADSLYSSTVVLHNAEAYAKQGVESPVSVTAYVDLTGSESIDAMLAAYGDVKGYINWGNSFGDTYDFATQTWTGAAENEVVDTGLTLKEVYDFYVNGAGRDMILSWGYTQEIVDGFAPDEVFGGYTYAPCDFEAVGIKAPSDTEVVFILDKAVEGFYLKYSLDISLVKTDLYDACESVVDGVYTNSYGTSVETTASYGPYMLTAFQSDKNVHLTRNPNWYGYSVPEWADRYQTTDVETTYVADTATVHEMFLKGQLDGFQLNIDYINDYLTSDYTYYSESPSVFAIALNPDKDALEKTQAAAGENINKTILSLKEFRMALSLGIDRNNFIASTDPTSIPAFSLYGATNVADPETGTFYRSMDVAKQVVVDFWGLTDEVGEGKLYATNDEAIESITGYNLEMARQYFDAAYDKAIAENLMDEDDVVEIVIGVPAQRPFYINGYEYIVNNYTEAVVGTKLEGKLTFKQDATVGNAFGDALRNNQVDMLFGVGWTGSAFDPFNLMQVFVDPNYQYDPAWDATTAEIVVTLDGVDYTASAMDWFHAITGTPITAKNVATGETSEMVFPYSFDAEEAETRAYVLACLENAVLQNYDFIPMMGDASAQLKGMQIEYPTEEEVFPMGYGGVEFYTYNYTDAEWDAFCAQNGTLNYK